MLLSDIPLKIRESSVMQEENVTRKLYADYARFREAIYGNLVKNNIETDKLLLFKKTQKLLDRFLFIFFAEDRLLLPPNSISEIVKQWKTLKELDEYIPLYDRFRKYFGYMNTGYKGKNYDIYAYNGGLFAPDEILDKVSIDDEILYHHALQLSQYDYDSEVDVNILGHIFEHSLSEIEQIEAEIRGDESSRERSKRKKDGIFYTPKYITKYIVENTLGRLCTEKRADLDIVDDDYTQDRKNRRIETIRTLDNKLTVYRNWLLNLSILDPACGSGAFLNQALEFLISEHHRIDEMQARLLDSPMVFPDITAGILEKNIYGVDLNEESVEIAKLSLWLRTAQKGRKLSSLSNNIQCGNSLISDREVAGEKAFDWHHAFPEVFHVKDKKAWHITTATHNSRYSQRMADYHVQTGEAIWLSEMEQMIVANSIAEIASADKLNILAWAVCGDHIHLLLVCEEAEVTAVVQKLKAVSSRSCNIAMGRTIPGTREPAPSSRLLAPGEEPGNLATKRGEAQSQLWTQKFGCAKIDSDEYLHNAIHYIQNNRNKHHLPVLDGMDELVQKSCCTIEYAFRTEYTGGFDVVIGNPPYVRAELLGSFRDYLSNNYTVFNPSGDLFAYFYEKSFQLLKKKTGIFGFISNTFDKTTAGISLRSFMKEKVNFIHYIDFTEVQIFEGATTYPVIMIAKNDFTKSNIFSYIKIPKEAQGPVIDIEIHDCVNVTQSLLHNENWSFRSNEAFALVDKMSKFKSIREIYGKSFYGVKTALNEAFIIPKSYPLGNHVKAIYEGRELSKWTLMENAQQLILFESKWTKKKYGSQISGEDALSQIKRDYPELISHIIPHTENAKKRFDQGDFFWELRNCAYYDAFEKPKIVFPNLQNNNKFAFDESSAYINAPAVILPTADVFLTAILNSKLIWFFLTSICVVRNGGYIEVKPQYFEQIPIPEINDDAKSILTSQTRQLMANVSEIQKTKSRFIKLLENRYPACKTTKKLENWHLLQFTDFVQELKKQKISLRLIEESEWLDYFETHSKIILSLLTQIDKAEKVIDELVFKLYSITNEEIRIMGIGI